MDFFHEPYIWTGFFGILGTAVGIFGAVARELVVRRTQLELERLRLHEKESINAYKRLYNFICESGDKLYPPEDYFESDFISIMKNCYFNEIKPEMIYFTPKIRKILQEFESQYICLSNQDMSPQISFKEFRNTHIWKYLELLRSKIEKETDKILQQDIK